MITCLQPFGNGSCGYLHGFGHASDLNMNPFKENQ